jgi:hypothetical protein
MIALKASGNGKLKISDLKHPNMMPFSGVLTYLNRLSTEPPHGASGLRVYIPTEVGAPAVASLRGMAVNYIQGNPTGHDPRQKVGVITDAKLGETQPDGAVPILIEGYIYSLDFEEAATSIKASQSLLGFSYETAQSQLVKGEVDGVPAAIVTSLGYFTGASILYRNSASYAETSLAASKEENKEEQTLDFEKLLAELKGALKEEVEKIRDEFKPKVEEVVKEEAPKAEEVVKETEKKVEEVVKEEAPKVEEAAKEVVAPVVEQVKEDAKVVTTPGQEVKPENAAPAAEQPKVEDATLNASSLLAELEAVKAELKAMKEQSSIQASARKSVAYPTTAIAKFGMDEESDKAKLMASIDARKDLTIEERIQLKFEAMNK